MIMDFTETVQDLNQLVMQVVVCLSLDSIDWIPDPSNHVDAKFVFDGIVGEAVIRV